MKNIYKLFGVIAIIAIIGFGFTACEEDSGGGGGLNFSVMNNTTSPITNIKVFDYDYSSLSKVGEAKYDSGTINIAADAKHEFKVSGLTWDNGTAYFQLEVTSSEGTATTASMNGDWYPAEFSFYESTGFGLQLKSE